MGKKYGAGIRRTTIENLKLAMGQDPNIAGIRGQLQEHPGSPESYLESLGLTKSDLLRLERHGFAVRGYSNPQNKYGSLTGYRTRWIIVMDETTVPDAGDASERPSEQTEGQ